MKHTHDTQNDTTKKMLKHLAVRMRDMQINVRVTADQYEAIAEKADTYTGGNVSEWMRYAASHYAPSESEVA